MSDNNSGAEELTVSVGIKRWVIADDDALWAFYKELRLAGWFGGILSMENIPGEHLQLTKAGQQLLVEVGNVVVKINDVLSSLTTADYTARYGAIA